MSNLIFTLCLNLVFSFICYLPILYIIKDVANTLTSCCTDASKYVVTVTLTLPMETVSIVKSTPWRFGVARLLPNVFEKYHFIFCIVKIMC